jgi:hypothetical protein
MLFGFIKRSDPMKDNLGVFLVVLLVFAAVGYSCAKSGKLKINVSEVLDNPKRCAGNIVLAVDIADRIEAKQSERACLDIKGIAYSIFYQLNETLLPLGDAELTLEEVDGYLEEIKIPNADYAKLLKTCRKFILLNVPQVSIEVQGKENKKILKDFREVVSLVVEGLR